MAGTATFIGVTTLVTTEAAATGVVPAPQNLRPTFVGPDRIEVTYGPQQPGVQVGGAATARSLVINFGASRDDLYPSTLTYDVTKNGKPFATGLTRLWYKVGFTRAVRTFTTCVTAHTANGYSPKRCSVWTAS